ncbi:MAG: anaerobic ribonucleoside-triphosphate reductase activating protein [Schwartzia sp.]|nr:anaerobic ribonucleoside-triphosphate reductase activating protein [Schwartzia sp. (in: firmicutes)]
MKIRIAGVVDDSVVDGDGYRFTIFTQGCPHHCHNCHNPETWSFDGGRLDDTDEILMELMKNPLLSGVTFSGGEPFAQAAPLADMAKKIHRYGLNVWCYSGYTLEELRAMEDDGVNELLDNIDVLVDGEYRESERDLTLRFRGSRNQRVIDMRATRMKNEIVIKYVD